MWGITKSFNGNGRKLGILLLLKIYLEIQQMCFQLMSKEEVQVVLFYEMVWQFMRHHIQKNPLSDHGSTKEYFKPWSGYHVKANGESFQKTLHVLNDFQLFPAFKKAISERHFWKQWQNDDSSEEICPYERSVFSKMICKSCKMIWLCSQHLWLLFFKKIK